MYLSKKSVKTFALSVVVVSMLTACHSSKKSPQPDPVTPPAPPAPTPASMPLKVSDGYLVGATVFLDLDRDKALDSGEPTGVTAAGGLVTLNTTGIDNPSTYPIVALATVASTVDEDTGAAVDKGFSLSAPAGTVNINPITTLIQSAIETAAAAGQTITVDEAVATVITQLGLTGATKDQMLGDYLADKDTNAFSKQLHALARAIVQLLPEDAADLASSLAGQGPELVALAKAINDVIAQGGDPDTITVVVTTGGGVTVSVPEVAQAKEFIADFRTWATKINADISTPADNFGNKADAALMVVESDIDALMSTAADVMMVIEERMMAGSLNDLSVADFANASNDSTVEVVEDIVVSDTQMKGKISLDLTFGSEKIMLMVDIDSGPKTGTVYSMGMASATGSLSNDKVSVAVTELMVNIDGVMLATNTTSEDLSNAIVSMSAKVNAESLATSQGILNASVEFAAKAAKHATSGELGIIPTKLAFSGSFGTGDEAFEAMLAITSMGNVTLNAQGDIVETVDNWLDATAILSVDVELTDFSGARIDLEVTRNGLSDGMVKLDLTYGDSMVSLMANTMDEKGTLKITDNDGVMMVLKTLDVVDGEKVGEILLGVKTIASITLVNNVHKIKYVDGSFATLF